LKKLGGNAVDIAKKYLRDHKEDVIKKLKKELGI
jgi:hypothetical protein